MPDVYSKCGNNCSLCPWSLHIRKTFRTNEDFQRYRDRCKKILGYQPMKKPCLTCQTPDEKLPKGTKIPLRNCLIRQCTTKMGIENCAYCSRFTCGMIKDQGTAWTREKCEAEKGPISEEDYLAFVEPFEGLKHLEAIRAALKREDIVEAITVPPLKTEIVDFPENLPFSEEEKLAFKRLHQMLARVKNSSLGLTDTDTFAQQQRLKKRRAHFLRFLWILGRFGKSKKQKGAHLEGDAKTYIANRGSETALASWSSVKDMVFKIFPKFGVNCKRVALEGVKEKDLTTGTGYLRQKGWVMTMAFDKVAGGVAVLKVLQTYTEKLDDKYGKKAFRHFSKADMHALQG